MIYISNLIIKTQKKPTIRINLLHIIHIFTDGLILFYLNVMRQCSKICYNTISWIWRQSSLSINWTTDTAYPKASGILYPIATVFLGEQNA